MASRHPVLAWFSIFFFISGFCSLVYQVVWLRLAMADFGVTTPMVSIVVSLFMAGLGLGSFGGGRLAQRLEHRDASAPLRLYALAELVIALSGGAVPRLLEIGRGVLLGAPSGAAWGSAGFYLASGGWVALVMLPFCTCMGATFPLAMSAIRRVAAAESTSSFSRLYVANVVGAMAGCTISAFVLIELLGFRGTLALTAALNALLAAAALAVSLRPELRLASSAAASPATEPSGVETRWILSLLFATGLTSMGLELVWIRQLTPYCGNVVYTFALVLGVYLLATFLGSAAYRRWGRPGSDASTVGLPLAVVGLLALLPVVVTDPLLPLRPIGMGRISWTSLGIVLLAIGPFCAVVGALTPMLLDRHARGEPGRAGSAYALNVVGCILGPLVSSFWLMPVFGERWATAALAAPLFLLALVASGWLRTSLLACVLALPLMLVTGDFERRFPGGVVRRDATATVIAIGQGREKQLLVNGIGMTTLTPITKMMVHLPFAFAEKRPTDALAICFGMGTTFRSMSAWGAASTAVELVPSVPALFGYFHPDGPALLNSPRAHVVIDDGRRFLDRTRESYDSILIDPPPPMEAAGSSLLYSREFYQSASRRMRPDAILQQWIPGGEDVVVAACVRAVLESFPYVRGFRSVENWGLHLLASNRPIPAASAAVLAARMPPAAAADLVEWGPFATPEQQFDAVLRNEVPTAALVNSVARARTLTDDRPINEYFYVRRVLAARH